MERTGLSRPMAIALGLMSIIWVSPFAWLFGNAFDNAALGRLAFPSQLGVDNFLHAVSGDAGRMFMNSLLIAAGTATISSFVGICAAYPLSRLRMPGKNALLWTLVLLRMLPAAGVLVPIYFTAQRAGLLNQLGVMLTLTVLNLPFTLLLLKNFFDTVPIELEEAAYVDGASLWQIVSHIVLPMSKAGIAVVWFFSFTGAWNEFLLPLIFSRVEAGFPMSVGLYAAFGRQGSIDYGFLTAFSIVYAAPAVGVYFLLRRNMNTGFAGVGVKDSSMNTLSKQLGLLDDDIKQEEKLFRLCADLGAKILTPITGEFGWRYTELELTADEALNANWRSWGEFTPKTVWAKKQGHQWFAAEVTVPESARGKTFVLRFTSAWQDRPGTTDPQCLAYLDGHVAQAIDGNHNELVIERDAEPGSKHILLVNAFTFFDRPLVGFQVDLMVRHARAEKLYFDLLTPLEVATMLTQIDSRRHAILNLVEASLRALDRRGVVTPEFEASLPAAEAIAAKIYDLVDTETQPTISAVGHTHLDVGWLWRVLHTRDKTGRSFATVLNLMTEYPGFIFMYNQSVLFNFLKTDYPEIWARLVEKVKSGQFEIEGAMWVEPDANIVSGESMVRQIMRGRRFHIENFGVTPKTVWLPDTFGYSANMPQILTRSGVEYFVTSKLSWNDTDRHPYDTFWWKGIDGTSTKAQLITAQKFDSDRIFTTYNSDLSVSEVMGAWKRYEPKAINDEVLLCYGFGDGGGGPTRAMIERGIRLERGIPGAPKVKLEGIVPFLDRLGKKMDADKMAFPVWNGELYLQYHRGTLTNVAKNKANNRKSERLLRELEYLSAMALSRGVPYPADELLSFWETVLINQFHDILPGTSIAEVYVDSDAEYDSLFLHLSSGNGPWHTAARALAPRDGGLQLFNFTGHERTGLVRIDNAPANAALSAGGDALPLQQLHNADGTTTSAAPATVPALGWTSASLVAAVAAPKSTLSASTHHLENDLIRVVFDANGEITSVFDKARARELIAPGQTANRLVAYEDKSLNWDAWDIDHYFEEQSWPLKTAAKIELIETGPYRAAIRIERTYQSSKFVQVVSLEAGAKQVEFDAFIDWVERQTVMKAEFPFDLNVSEIRSEIQFGHVKRPTHRNTSWDKARFEASMHRWVDMSEPDFGGALLNDCKYGYDAYEQLIRLTLVRGSTMPNADSDIGQHRIKYALLVHAGTSDLASVPVAAERFNNPVAVSGTPAIASQPAAPSTFSFASVDAPNVTLETVKKAEKSDALVLRLYEHANTRAKATIHFGVPVRSARLVNLMEEGAEAVEVRDNSVTLNLRPFEIATLMLEV